MSSTKLNSFHIFSQLNAFLTSIPPLLTTGENRSGDKALRTIFRRLCGQTRNGLCPIVERVMLSEGCKITDKGLQLLSRRCPSLSHLQLQNSTSVTNQALFDLVTKCSTLQHLDITGKSIPFLFLLSGRFIYIATQLELKYFYYLSYNVIILLEILYVHMFCCFLQFYYLKFLNGLQPCQ